MVSKDQLLRLGISTEAVAIYVQGAKVLLLAVYLLLSTRLLGPEGYGYIAVAVSLVALCTQFVGLGSGIANVREASRDPATFSYTWGMAVARYGISGFLLSGLYIGIGSQFASQSLDVTAIVLIAFSELVFLPLSIVSAYAFMADGSIRTALLLQLSAPGFKSLLLLFCVVGDVDLTINAYAWLMMVGSALAALISLSSALWHLPAVTWPRWGEVWKIRHDLLYSVNSLTNQSAIETSKPLTLQLSGASDAGVYGAASRVVSAAAMPMTAVIQSQAHRLFKMGRRIGKPHFWFVWRYGLVFFTYSLACSAGFYLLANEIGRLLGGGFDSAGRVVAWFSLWLPVFGLRQLIGAVLTTSDRVKLRIGFDLASLAPFFVIALIIVPKMGPEGMVLALFISECFWVGCAGVVFFRCWKSTLHNEK